MVYCCCCGSKLLRLYQEHCFDGSWYTMESQTNLIPLQDLMRGLAVEACCNPVEDIIDDDALAGLSSANENNRMLVFKMLHKQPKHQQLFRSVSSALRSDHVAVSVYSVTDKSWESRTANVCGSHLEGHFDSVKVLSLHNFIEYTAPKLNK